MANLNELQMQPIQTAANALNNLADDPTQDEIALAITTTIDNLSEVMERLEITDRTAITLLDKWKKAQDHLSMVHRTQTQTIAERLLSKNNGTSIPIVIDTEDGEIICTPRIKIGRKIDITQREDVMRAVERATANKENRLNPDGSGELLDYDTAKVVLFKKVFRMEPRWTEAKKLNINPDDYSSKSFSYTLDIQKAAKL